MSDEIKNIVFDFNGVISKANKKDIVNKLNFQDVCNLVCYGFSFLTKSGFRKDLVDAYRGIMMGNCSCKTIYELFENEHQNRSQTIEKIVENFVSSMKTQEGLIQLVDYLRANGMKVFILSNSIPKTEQMIKSAEINQHFDGVYCSSEHGLIKPNRDIFDDACKLWGISPEESIFVDDKKENVKGALDAGFGNAFHLTDEEKIINKISESVLQ